MSVLVTDKPSKKLSQNLIFRTIERVFEHKNSLICLRDDDFFIITVSFTTDYDLETMGTFIKDRRNDRIEMSIYGS